MTQNALGIPNGIGFGNEDFKNYDEGAYTVTLTAPTTNPTSTTTYGRYTRIGRVVHAEVYIEFGVGGSQGTGDRYAFNLPFALTNATQKAVGHGMYFRPNSGWAPIFFQVGPGSSSVECFTQDLQGVGSRLAPYVPFSWDSGSYFIFNITYTI
jgi:hypothetical protein